VKWLLLVAIGCSDRPIPLSEEVRHIDAPDLAHALPRCGGDCQCDGYPCETAAQCCSLICDPVNHICASLQTLPDLSVPACQGPGGCVTSGCPCAANSDCCAGLACVVPAGGLTGTCGNQPQPPDMACTEGVPVGGPCRTTADCCAAGVGCVVQQEMAYGVCEVEDCSHCGPCVSTCFPIGHCCSSNADCCSGVCDFGCAPP